MSRSPLLDIEFNRRLLVEVFKEVMKLKENIDVYLDLGAGDGSLTEFVSRYLQPKRTIVVDIDPTNIEICKSKGFEAHLLDLNRDELPFLNDSIDLVTMFETLEHICNTDHALKEVFRVLRPGGIFILSTPNLASWINRLALLLGRPPYHYNVSFKYPIHGPLYRHAPYGHIRLYTHGLLLKHLEAVGFRACKIYGALTPINPLLLRKITIMLSKIRPSLASDLIFIATKPARVR